MKEININSIKGFKIGHAEDIEGGTGCTAIICEKGGVAGVDIRGGAPATRETALLDPVKMVEQIHCIMISGGSAYGLEAGDGAMKFLEEKGIGFNVEVAKVPIVCGASLFDLVVGNPGSRPDKVMGYLACEKAFKRQEDGILSMGNVGAGTGASIGKFLGIDRMMKSGLGHYALEAGEVQCGAIVAVNALGDVFDVDSKEQIGGILSEDKMKLNSSEEIMYREIEDKRNVFENNTTIGCILTNAKITKSEASKIATMAHNGYARAINPVHTSADGDTIFVFSTGEVEVNPDTLGTLAAKVMGKAINNGVKSAEPSYGLKAYSDFY